MANVLPGFTRYIERRILGQLYGQAYRGLLLTFGYFDLMKNVEFLSATPNLTTCVPGRCCFAMLALLPSMPFSSASVRYLPIHVTAPPSARLLPDLTKLSPDDAFSRIPYEKGSLFLYYLEKPVGGEAAMSGWLKEYFTDFSKVLPWQRIVIKRRVSVFK